MKLHPILSITLATVMMVGSFSALAADSSAGDLGLSSLDQPKGGSSGNHNIGLGLNYTLRTGLPLVSVASSAAGRDGVTALSLRIWLDRLEIEPLLGLGFAAGNGNTAVLFTMGGLIGYALSMGNLRPIIGGGITFAIESDGKTQTGLTFGPMFALEYRFTELPQLSFEAAIFFPFGMNFDPFIFSFVTAGNIIGGFHYYF